MAMMISSVGPIFFRKSNIYLIIAPPREDCKCNILDFGVNPALETEGHDSVDDNCPGVELGGVKIDKSSDD